MKCCPQKNYYFRITSTTKNTLTTILTVYLEIGSDIISEKYRIVIDEEKNIPKKDSEENK